MGRAPCCDKASVKKGPWSPEEDAKLKAYIEEHGTAGNWIALPQKIGLKRCGKSCRLRWLNYLRPNIKHGGFSEDEDQIILNLYISIGSRWSIIAAQLPGRTDNDVKNYWNTRLKKKLLGKQRRSEDHHSLRRPQCRLPANQPVLEPAADTAILNHETLCASALERMQLHLQLQRLHPPANFYSNNPTALWPTTSLVSDKIFESQHDAMLPNFLLQQYARNDSSLLQISGQEDQDHTLGFSPSSSAGGGRIGGPENPCSDYNSPVTGLQSSEGNQMHTEPDCDLREMYGDHQKGVSMGWWSSDDTGFEEKAALMGGYSASSSLQLDSLMFQDQFVLGYDH